jgi:hypothetical protein
VSMSKRAIGPLGIALLCWSQQVNAFECPRMERTGPGVLQETNQDEQALSRMFQSGNVEDEIGITVSDLQRKYPQASDTELANYLIGAYCPAVASMCDVSDAQKTSRVEHFAASSCSPNRSFDDRRPSQ